MHPKSIVLSNLATLAWTSDHSSEMGLSSGCSTQDGGADKKKQHWQLGWRQKPRGKLGTVIKDVMPKWQDVRKEELDSERHSQGDISSN